MMLRPTREPGGPCHGGGHGGQVLLAAVTRRPGVGFDLLDLGEHRLPDLGAFPDADLAAGQRRVPAVADARRGAGQPSGAADQFRRPGGEVEELAAPVRDIGW